MGKIILYSMGCPKCLTLEHQLTDAGITFSVRNSREEVMDAAEKANTDFMPILKVGEDYMDYNKAMNWIEEVCNE